MTSRDFVYWLQGFFEIHAAGNRSDTLVDSQVRKIKQHLALVFKHEIDPSAGDEKHQAELNAIHDGDLKKLQSDVEKLKNKKPQYVRPPLIRC